jgi:hypothetical protein
MKQSFFTTGQLTITTALLGALLAGCAEGGNIGETADDPAEDQSREEVAIGGAGEGEEQTGEVSSSLNGSLFNNPMPWTKDVSGLSPSPQSATIINWLAQNGGWGSGNVMKIDFGLTVLKAGNASPKKSFIKTADFYSPDCDHVSFPIPAGGAIEAEQGYECTQDGDCHLLVVHSGESKLYEMWRANITGGTFYGGCGAVWDLTKIYPESLRGEGCTSADAGGFPITAMLFTPEEVQSGAIEHAIRFILPNTRIRKKVYVHPATHSTSATSGPSSAPPYGVRFRLRANYPLQNLPSNGARTIAKAMQKYGMLLSDGGNIALTGASDRFSNVKWTTVGVNSQSLKLLKVTDFEVVDMGAPIQWNGDCDRN